jgi:hypothetical protein
MVFDKIKKKLGIEGVKMSLEVPENIKKEAGLLPGHVQLTSLSDNNKILSIEIQIIEKYTRGRGNQKLIDEYAMGKTIMNKAFLLHKDDVIRIPFELEFAFVPSEMDRLEEKNFITKGLVRLAKKARGVTSEYSVRAHAVVEGTALHPHDTKVIQLT